MADDDKTFEATNELVAPKRDPGVARRVGQGQGTPWNQAGTIAWEDAKAAAGVRSLTFPSGDTVFDSDH